MLSLIKAIRIQMHLREKEIKNNQNSGKSNLLNETYLESIFVKDEGQDQDFLQNSLSVKVSIPFLNGLIESIWRRFDEDESGFLQRKEFYKFFEDIFKGAGMEGFRID